MPVNSVIEVPYHIALAISLASNTTGIDFDYLLKTAAYESNFQSGARAKTSSAQGLYQFIEETWLHTIKEEGHRYGLQHHANRIFRSRKGRYYVPDAKQREMILALRNNPKIAAVMAGEFAKKNLEILHDGLGRKPTAGELYIAHFLGARHAVKLIHLAKTKPHQRANRAFPAAAKANRTIFYKKGHARSVREVYQLLTRRLDEPAKKNVAHTSSRSWNTLVVNRREPTKLPSNSEERTTPPHKQHHRKLGRAKRIVIAIPQLPIRKQARAFAHYIDHGQISKAVNASLPNPNHALRGSLEVARILEISRPALRLGFADN